MNGEYGKKDFALEIDIKEVQEDGTFSGFASTFGGKPDSYGDIVVAGAFAKTITKNGYGGNGIKMLLGHDTTKVIGVWTSFAENSKGLLVQGKLAIKTTLGSDVYELVKIGALNTMSIGYNVNSYEIEKQKDGKQIRYLKEIDLWEVSLVTFPANVNARVTGVKTITMEDISDVKDVRQAEQALCDAGFSIKASKYLISVLKKSNHGACDGASLLNVVENCKENLKKLLEE